MAITNARLVCADDQAVVFGTPGVDAATVSPTKFIGRFLLHILPSRFVKTRHFGLMASGNLATKQERARSILPASAIEDAASPVQRDDDTDQLTHVDPTLLWPALRLALTGIDALQCPGCQQPTMVRQALP